MVRKINVLAGGWRKRAHETDQHRAFEATATRALANVPWTTDAWRDALAGRVVEHVLGRRVLPPAIANAMRSTVADIIRLETNLLRLPDTEPDDLLEAVAYRARLRALLTFKENSDRLFERWIDALGAILRAIADAVPSSSAPVHAASVLSAPLIDLIPKSTQLVTDLVARIMQFANDDPHAVRPGSVLAHLCKEALLTVSEIDETTARKHPRRLIAPNKSGLSGEALLEAFLPEPFHALLSTPIPFQIPHHIYAEHGAIFSKSGHGKSQTLRAIVASLLQGEDPPALFIMDSLGALIEDIDKLHIFTTHLRDRLVIIDPADTRPPALNFFKLQSDDLIFYLFKSIDQSFTPRQSTMIAYLMELMRHIHDATLLTLVQVCESRDNLFPDVLAKLSPFAQSFFAQQFHAKKPDPFVQQTKNQIAQRIYSLGRMGKFAQMFSARENKFDPLRFMKEKKICIINTDARPVHLGGLGEASNILGGFILAQCLDAARSRPKDQRHLALLVVDEAKHYMDDQAALILSDARQFGLGLLLATQFPHQLPEGVRREINTNTSIKMMGPTEFAVAAQYARDMFTSPEMIMGMKSFNRSHAEWMTYVANVTDRAVKLSVPFGAIDQMPRMTPAEHDNLRAINRQRYGLTLDDTAKIAPENQNPPSSPDPLPGHDLPASPPTRDFGKYEPVSLLGLTCNALLGSGAQASAIVAIGYRKLGTPTKPRISFTIATRDGTHTFERPVIGSRVITGMHGATVECPVVALDITLDDYSALESFAVTVDPAVQSQPVILGDSFFAAAPFAIRISPSDSMLSRQRRQKKRTRTQWDSDHGEADEV